MVIAGSDCPPDSLRGQPRPGPAPDVWDWSDSRGSRVACVAVEIPGRGCGQLRRRGTRSVRGRCGPQDSGRMRSSLTPVGPPVSRDRVITSFPKWYTPDACLQLKEHFDRQVSTACQRRDTGTVGLQLSKVVVVGDLYVGKTSLIHRFCKNMFDRDYKATIGVDFEIERFEVAGVPYSLQIWDTAGQEKFKCIASAYYRGAQVIVSAFDLTDIQTLEHTRQWLKDALRENEAGSCLIFLVGTKKDLLSGAACEQAEAEAVQLAREMQAEYWGEREGVLQPCRCPGVRAVSAAGPGQEEQRPAPGRRWRPHPDGGKPTRDPRDPAVLQPGLLLAGACVTGPHRPPARAWAAASVTEEN
ncbi:ras-related protein Rab-36 isoform X1 [Oryctolagus cuniculus]|uniref:ras-related protein Rab-36 isoform X1 n=1 Tax=Oryctolagus cuniculus TaxID=9986 RepID=UPI0022328D6D|nr:ras-related protein Rab-36 isoform X1 [Oryctolagus cuniculus]